MTDDFVGWKSSHTPITSQKSEEDPSKAPPNGLKNKVGDATARVNGIDGVPKEQNCVSKRMRPIEEEQPNGSEQNGVNEEKGQVMIA
ncbi:uncharacterized protein [Physcomitrium patens]|uniref:uncharacterized protein isoform X1 n=1 Tax=Physcomitrium patens TaxID=3218 RepID=UPI003CCD5A25